MRVDRPPWSICIPVSGRVLQKTQRAKPAARLSASCPLDSNLGLHSKAGEVRARVADQVNAMASNPEQSSTGPVRATTRKLKEANSSRMVRYLVEPSRLIRPYPGY